MTGSLGSLGPTLTRDDGTPLANFQEKHRGEIMMASLGDEFFGKVFKDDVFYGILA